MENFDHVQSKLESTRHVVTSSFLMLKSSAHLPPHASPPPPLNQITFRMGKRTVSATDIGFPHQGGGPHISTTTSLICTVLPMQETLICSDTWASPNSGRLDIGIKSSV